MEESNEIGIIITDAKQAITHINRGFTSITGYTFKESIGRNCNFLQGKETAKEAVLTIRDSLSRNEQCRVAILNYTKFGEPFWNLLIVTPTIDSLGRISNYVGIQMRRSYFYVDRPTALFPWTTLDDPSPVSLPPSSSFLSRQTFCTSSTCTHLCSHCSNRFDIDSGLFICSYCKSLHQQKRQTFDRYPYDNDPNLIFINKRTLERSLGGFKILDEKTEKKKNLDCKK